MGVQNFFLVTAVLDVGRSGRHHKTLPVDLLAQSHGGFTKRLPVPERGIANARQLVGQRTRRLVVVAPGLHIERPAAHPAHLAPGVVGYLGRTQHAPGAVREQHAQVAVALLGDAPQVARTARAVLAVQELAFELGACETLGLHHTPVLIGHGKLKHGLCKIDGNGSSIHVGLLTFEDLIPTPMKTRAPLLRKQRGASIPSIDRAASSVLRTLPVAAHAQRQT